MWRAVKRPKAHQVFILKTQKIRMNSSMSAGAGMNFFATNDQIGSKQKQLLFGTRHHFLPLTTPGSLTSLWNGFQAHSPCSSKQLSKTSAHPSTGLPTLKKASRPFQSPRQGSFESLTVFEVGMQQQWRSCGQNASMIWTHIPSPATKCVHSHLFLVGKHPKRGPSFNTAWQKGLR